MALGNYRAGTVRRARLLVRVGAGAGALCLASSAAAAQREPPKLVVVISVDQMRPDYLVRFGSFFTNGFGRLTQNGTLFTQAYHDHGITSTAPGHATIVTGVYPNRSGIVSNDWWDRNLHRPMYAVEDLDTRIVGSPNSPGRSPANLWRETVGDWLKQQSPRSKVYSVALKDRAAILMGGHNPDGTYWFDVETGWFVTSTHYRRSLPRWVRRFNRDGQADSYFDDGWERLLTEDMYGLSREDSFPSENDGMDITFPHQFRTYSDKPDPIYYDELIRTPFGDELAISFVKELIDHEDLGEDSTVDLLFLGASAADYVGHRYGPYSQELQDYYMRFDIMLGGLLDFLDEKVGAGSYNVVLTSDHGMLPMPEELERRGVDAKRIDELATQELIIPPLARALSELAIDAPPKLALLYGLAVDFPEGTVADEKLRELRRMVARSLRDSELIADAYAYDDVVSDSDDRYRQMHWRSFHPDRASDIIIRYKRHYLRSSEPGGTNHESPYEYDRNVPLLFWGPGITGTWFDRPVRTVDIAPTVAALLGIEPPDDLDGEVLVEVIP